MQLEAANEEDKGDDAFDGRQDCANQGQYQPPPREAVVAIAAGIALSKSVSSRGGKARSDKLTLRVQRRVL